MKDTPSGRGRRRSADVTGKSVVPPLAPPRNQALAASAKAHWASAKALVGLDGEKAELRAAENGMLEEATKDAPRTSRRGGAPPASEAHTAAPAASATAGAARRTPRRGSATNAIDALGQHNFYVKSELRAKARAEADREIEQIRLAAEAEIGRYHAEARAIWEEVGGARGEYDHTMADLQERKAALTQEVAAKEQELADAKSEQQRRLIGANAESPSGVPAECGQRSAHPGSVKV